METQNQLITTRAERPNSWEAGKTGNRFKIFFEDASDLQKQVIALQRMGFDIDAAIISGEEEDDKENTA